MNGWLRSAVVAGSAFVGSFCWPRIFTPKGGELEFLATDVWIKRGVAWQVLSRHLSLIDR